MSKNKKLKIAQVVSYQESVPPRSKNGLEFVVSWLTEELVRRGHKVTLFAPANSKTKAKLISFFPHETTTLKKTIWDFGRNDFSSWNTSLVAEKSNDFDIIHSHTGTIKKFMPFIDKPAIYTIHEPYQPGLVREYLKNKKYNRYFKFILNQYQKINYVTISKKQQRDYKETRPYYFKKFFNIYNGLPIEKFEFNNMPKDYLFYLGYVNSEKGADVAVKIAKKIKMKLFLAGDKFGQEKFFNKKIKPFLNKDIKYIGPLNFKQKINYLKNAKAVLNPIIWNEPFGLVPVEAQACGTPVIAFNKGAMPEIIKHGKTGFVVETEKEMISAIKNIDKIKRKDCRKWVEKNFSVKKMVDEYEKLYYKLANKK